MENFHKVHEKWLQKHCQGRKGEARRRLEEGYGVAERAFVEKVWWPAVGHLEQLIPEYEIRDYSDGQRFMDFAYVNGALRVCMEVDGFGPHWRDINRRQFADQWMRQNHLVLDGWRVLRFAYDDVLEKPRRCQQIIQQMLGMVVMAADAHGASSGESGEAEELNLLEREILRCLRSKREGQINAAFVKKEFKVSTASAYRALHKLKERHYLAPVKPGTQQVFAYILAKPD
ncbi:MAG: DNA-binding response regulator [Paenibacillaceae bacterium]|nr:DNA-binding response regulator [Paenibacillaceae bacterium]